MVGDFCPPAAAGGPGGRGEEGLIVGRSRDHLPSRQMAGSFGLVGWEEEWGGAGKRRARRAGRWWEALRGGVGSLG